MSIQELIGALPDYAEDQKRNLELLAGQTVLSDQRKWGCFLACALARGEPSVVEAMEDQAKARLSPQAITAARSVVAIMAMNTVYFRAVHLLTNHDYRNAPAGLSMEALTHPGIDKSDHELWNLAVSAVYGCGVCLNAHEAELQAHDVPMDQILAALRIAAVINATSAVYSAQAAVRAKN